MNLKWFYGTLFVLLAVLGVKMDRAMLSNQEIVVQFTEEGFSEDKAQQAIAEVKGQLQEVGVENIQISKLNDGGLKITYYSDLAVSEIQQVLSDADLHTQRPIDTSQELPTDESGEDLMAYELNVYEIHGPSVISSDIGGTLASEHQLKQHTYLTKITAFSKGLDLSSYFEAHECALQYSNRSAALRTLQFYTLPEVRAGPLA